MSNLVVHVPENDKLKRYSIAKFNPNLHVDVQSWKQKELRMQREDNRNHTMISVMEQDYGEGSEYGRAAREEARRKKFGRQSRTYSIDKQPWLLSVKDFGTGKDKKYKSIVDRTGEHADYWIFVKDGAKFNAHKINEWYQFMPQVQHKVLDIDQAEEQFQLRSKVMNQFALKAKIQQQLRDNDGEDGGKTVRGNNLLIKDELSSEEENGSDGEGSETEKKPKKKPNAKPKKDKKVRVQNSDEVAKYESEDGEDDGLEFDYMSDSGSDTDRDEKTADEKAEEQLVGVGEEAGLKKLIESGSEDEDEEEDASEEDKELATKLKEQADDSREKSDESEDEDLDASSMTSPLLLQKKVFAPSEDRKRPADQPDSTSPSKRPKIENSAASGASADSAGPSSSADAQQEVLLTDRIRRLLLRRPHTTKELLNLIRPQFEGIDKQKLVTKLANVLKALSATQKRRHNGKKETLYFSLEP